MLITSSLTAHAAARTAAAPAARTGSSASPSGGPAAPALDAFVRTGARLSLAAIPTGVGAGRAITTIAALGVPVGQDGAPDFEAVRAHGGTVIGAIPPHGYEEFTFVDQTSQTTYYAAQIDLGDGSPPRYVKGVDLQAMPTASARERREALAEALHFFDLLPDSLDDARRRASENLFFALESRVDLTL